MARESIPWNHDVRLDQALRQAMLVADEEIKKLRFTHEQHKRTYYLDRICKKLKADPLFDTLKEMITSHRISARMRIKFPTPTPPPVTVTTAPPPLPEVSSTPGLTDLLSNLNTAFTNMAAALTRIQADTEKNRNDIVAINDIMLKSIVEMSERSAVTDDRLRQLLQIPFVVRSDVITAVTLELYQILTGKEYGTLLPPTSPPAASDPTDGEAFRLPEPSSDEAEEEEEEEEEEFDEKAPLSDNEKEFRSLYQGKRLGIVGGSYKGRQLQRLRSRLGVNVGSKDWLTGKNNFMASQLKGFVSKKRFDMLLVFYRGAREWTLAEAKAYAESEEIIHVSVGCLNPEKVAIAFLAPVHNGVK